MVVLVYYRYFHNNNNMENIFYEFSGQAGQIILIIVTLIIMLIGLVGEILPVIPGMILIWIAALIYAIIDKFHHLSPWTILILIIIWLLAAIIDWITTWFTAKKVGISFWGLGLAVAGAIIGTILGNLPGTVLGMVEGAIIGEYIQHQQLWKSMQVGSFIILGWLAGNVLKLIMAISMILIFLVSIVW